MTILHTPAGVGYHDVTAVAHAGYFASLPTILQLLSMRRPPYWKLGAAGLAVAAVIYVGIYLSQIERRYPIIHYKQVDLAVSERVANRCTHDCTAVIVDAGGPGHSCLTEMWPDAHMPAR